jgi:hypothetical protein
MAAREQLRILAFVLPDFFQRGTRHFRAAAPNELAKPTLRPLEI